MDRNAYVDSIMEKLNKRIKKGTLTVSTEKKLYDSVIIRYYCKDTWPGIGYGHIITRLEMLMYGNNDDDLVEHLVSEMADALKEKGYDPSEYLEV